MVLQACLWSWRDAVLRPALILEGCGSPLPALALSPCPYTLYYRPKEGNGSSQEYVWWVGRGSYLLKIISLFIII